MPLYFLALLRLNSASRSSDPSRSSGSKPSKLSHPDRRLCEDLPRDGDHDRPVAQVFKVLDDGQVGDGPGPQHRTVGLLAPQEAEHVASRLRVRQRLGQVQHARGDQAAVELADAERRDVALHDAPGAMTSAPKLTNDEMTRSRPTASMRVSAVRPFCTVST